MSFPQYLNYKPSPIECAPSVPAHWAISKLKRVMEFRTGWTPPTGRDDYYRGPNPWVTIGDMRSKYLEVTEKQISDEAARVARMSPVPKGSLLFSFKLSIGQVSFAGCELYTNEAIASFSPDGSLNLGYCYYAFPIFVSANAAENIYGAKLLNQQLIGDATILIPSISEQQEIARFLDNETGKIDELIAEQERLIELLKEKRQAVISQAVTKGLNPDAPMKPSGVEWLGDVPEHWNTTRLVFLATKIGSGKTPLGGALVYESSGVIFIRSQNVYDDGIRLDDVSFISDEIDSEMSATRVLSWDVLLNITGASIGRCALVPKEFLAANVNQHVCILRFGDSCVARWVHACLCSNAAKEQIRSLQTGSGREGLNFSQVGAIRVTMPPDKEIESILNYLGKEMHRIDSALADMENSRILLRERRSALISAAVTGQIDVRGFAEQSAA